MRGSVCGIVVALSLGCSSGCGSNGGTSTSDSGAEVATADGGGDVPTVVTADSSASDAIVETGDDTTTACTSPTPPAGMVPSGWLPFTDFSCLAPLYVPPDAAHFPDPIAWEVCTTEFASSYACKRMKVSAPYLDATGLSASIRQDASGHFIANFLRANGRFAPVMWVVADIDGGVFAAALATLPLTQGLAITPAGTGSTTFGLALRGGQKVGVHADSQTAQGLVLARKDASGVVQFNREETADTYTWDVNDKWALRAAALAQTYSLFPVGGGAPNEIYRQSSDPDGAQLDRAVLNGGDVVFGVADLRYAGLMAYDSARGAHALVRWFGDNTQGAIGPGTDGVDLVWTYGSGHPAGEGAYATTSYMTSPYSTDPAFVSAHTRRLRSNKISLDPTVVGCGYLAQTWGTQANLVRLSDGVAWTISGATSSTQVLRALAVSCTEVFLLVTMQVSGEQRANIFRIRLDSLGAGSPPD